MPRKFATSTGIFDSQGYFQLMAKKMQMKPKIPAIIKDLSISFSFVKKSSVSQDWILEMDKKFVSKQQKLGLTLHLEKSCHETKILKFQNLKRLIDK